MPLISRLRGIFRLRLVLYRVALCAALLGSWQLVAEFGLLVNPLFISRPTAIATIGWDWLRDGTLVSNAAVSLQEALTGWAIGASVGALLGYLVASWRTLDDTLMPLVDALMALPRLALIPLFIIWFGIGSASKVALVFAVVVVIVYIATNSAVKSCDAELIRLARSMAASRSAIARKVVVPWCIPFVFAALRVAMSLGLTAAVVGEMFVGQRGLGVMLSRESGSFNIAGVMTVVFTVVVIAYLMSLLLNGIERRLLKWRPPAAVSQQQ